jgi:hypothetical protein
MSAAMDYLTFIANKTPKALERGLSRIPNISESLFPFQRHCAEFLLRVGSGGLFLDTGLGKTLVQLEYAEHARNADNGKALILWSNPGDTVLSPFMGIGSEGYQSIRARRKFIGIELKREYWRQACENLKGAAGQADMFAA